MMQIGLGGEFGQYLGVAVSRGYRFQAMAYANSFIEDEAMSLPEAFLIRDFFQIFQNAALELIDFGKTFGLQITGEFLTAYSTRAIGGNFGVLGGVEMFLDVLYEGFEGGNFGIYGPLEGSEFDFVIISRVQHQHIGGLNQIIPLSRRAISLGQHFRSDGLAERYGLFL